MLDLKRVYWTRQTLRLVMLAAMAWLLLSACLALMPNASKADQPEEFRRRLLQVQTLLKANKAP